jgi:hypothetical protein
MLEDRLVALVALWLFDDPRLIDIIGLFADITVATGILAEAAELLGPM